MTATTLIDAVASTAADLTLAEIITEYDGIIAVGVYTGADTSRWLAIWAEDDDLTRSTTWLLTPLTDDINNGAAPVRSAYAPTGTVRVITYFWDDADHSVDRTSTAADLPPEWLPAAEFTLPPPS